MIRGIQFEIPNKYGTFLSDVLKPIDIDVYDWQIGNGESYVVVDNQLEDALFLDSEEIIDGNELKKRLEKESYIIFADLKAFPKGEISDVQTYDEFKVSSKCELVVLVVDSCYVAIYCKDEVEILYKNAVQCGFENIEYITDKNDTRTGLSAW